MRAPAGSSVLALFAMTLLPGSAYPQSLSRLVPNLVFAEVTLAPGPTITPPVPGTPHTAHFSPRNPLFGDSADAQGFLDQQLQQVPALLRQANAQLATFPIGSSSGGFTFRFDPELGTFSRTSDSFGGLLTERALTLGRGQFNYGTVFQHTSYDRFEGRSLRDSEIVIYYPHNDCCPGQTPLGVPGGDGQLTNPSFEGDVLVNRLMVDLRTDTFGFFATMGVTNAFDLGVVVPIVHVTLDAAVERTILRLSTEANPLVHSFDNAGAAQQTDRASGSAVGVGDILLRGKYQFTSGARGALAASGELRLPTGDETELLGTGATQGRLAILASAVFGSLAVHGNVGYTASRSVSQDEAFVGSPADEFNYSIGFDAAVHPRVTAAIDFSGRRYRDVSRLVDAQFPVRFSTLDSPATVETLMLDGLSLELGDMNIMLGAAGLKVNVSRTLLLNLGLLFPLNEAGLHNRTTASVGLDYTLSR